MKANVGGLDRTLRIIGGLILLALGIFLAKPVVWTVVFIIIGALLILTGLFGFCALYIPLGISTRGTKSGPPPG
jgi:hypothetical protein